MSVTQDGPSPSPPPPAQAHGPTSSQPLQEGPQLGTLENRLAETGGASLDGAVRTAAPGVDGTARALLSPRYLCPGQGGPAHHGGGESSALPRAGLGPGGGGWKCWLPDAGPLHGGGWPGSPAPVLITSGPGHGTSCGRLACGAVTAAAAPPGLPVSLGNTAREAGALSSPGRGQPGGAEAPSCHEGRFRRI